MGVYDVLVERGVSRLCHFTKIQNLTHILSSPEGIISKNRIRGDALNQNDNKRLDGKTDFVCCSIEYPNSWFLSSAMDKNEDKIFKDWAVLYIKPEIVKLREVLVCECNAAKSNGNYIKDGNEINTRRLFAEKVESFKCPRTDYMLSCCTTNSQAEVMVKEGIPREFIHGIAVRDEKTADMIYAMMKTLELYDIDLYISPIVLSKNWRYYIEKGERPEEVLYKS